MKDKITINQVLEALKPELEKVLKGMTVEEFQEASNHPYNCQCRICKLWWENMPPEED